MDSYLERILASHLARAGIVGYVTEHRFHPPRKWQMDFAFPRWKVGVEVEGWGRHQKRAGYEKDCEKYNQAALDGWLLLRFTGQQVKQNLARPITTGQLPDPKAVRVTEQIKAALEMRRNDADYEEEVQPPKDIAVEDHYRKWVRKQVPFDDLPIIQELRRKAEDQALGTPEGAGEEA